MRYLNNIQIYVHNANIMQCISGCLECIKLHSISIRLRVPGLRVCAAEARGAGH